MNQQHITKGIVDNMPYRKLHNVLLIIAMSSMHDTLAHTLQIYLGYFMSRTEFSVLLLLTSATA